MKFLIALLPFFFAPIFLGAVVSNGPVLDQKTTFFSNKSSKIDRLEQKLEARLEAFSEPSDDEKLADRRALRAFVLGILGIGVLVMGPNWIIVLCIPLLLLAFFNGTAAIKKTWRRGLAITGIVLGSLVWVFLFAMLLALIGGGF